MNDVTVVQTTKGHTTIHYKGKMLATISGAGITREDRLKYAKTMASSLESNNGNVETSNVQKMREVIKALLDVMYDMGIDEKTVAIASESTNCHINSHKVLEVIKNAKSALAEPARNCDALSADDVKSRFKERMASSDMGLIGENIVEVVSGVVDFLYATEKGGEEGGAK